MTTGTSANAVPPQTLYLQQSMKLIYNISDSWFVVTVVFACLDFLAIVVAIILFFLKKRHRKLHLDFRRQKEYLVKYQNKYKTQMIEPEMATEGIASSEQMEFVEQSSPMGDLRSERPPAMQQETPGSDAFYIQH